MHDLERAIAAALLAAPNRGFHFSNLETPPAYNDLWHSRWSAGTPSGVYFWMAETWSAAHSYGGARKWVHVLAPTVPTFALDLCSHEQLQQDIEKIAAVIGPDKMAHLARRWEKWSTENFGVWSPHENPGAELWYYVTKALPPDWPADEYTNFIVPGVNDKVFSNRLLRLLEHRCVVDQTRIIWSSEPMQGLFTDNAAFETVETFPNPRYNPHFDISL